MSNYYKFLRGKVDLSPIGFTQRETNIPYFCTPKDARIIGWSGVDGIHYCAIKGFGEMIFVVNPTDFGAKYVYPIAHNLKTFISILAYYGDVLFANPLSSLDKTNIEDLYYRNDKIIEELSKYIRLSIIDDPFNYVKNLQDNFDYDKITFTQDFYDLDMNINAPEINKEWKVTYEGGFYHNKGRAAKAIDTNIKFKWNNEKWYIPNVYTCTKGMIIDFCVEVDITSLKSFMNEVINNTADEKNNPFNINFRFDFYVNKKKLNSYSGESINFIPENLLPDDVKNSLESNYVVNHYNLDKTKGWSIHRYSIPWITKKKPELKEVKLILKRDPVAFDACSFKIPNENNILEIEHPLSKKKYKIEIDSCDDEEFPITHLMNDSLELPKHYKLLKYSISPEISDKDFYIRDIKDNDEPRRKLSDTFSPEASYSAAIGIIGGADGPTAVFVTNKTKESHTAMSALTFEPKEEVMWKVVFREKLYEDIKISLI